MGNETEVKQIVLNVIYCSALLGAC